LYITGGPFLEAEIAWGGAEIRYTDPRDSPHPERAKQAAVCGLDIRLPDGQRLCLYELVEPASNRQP